MLHLQQKRHTGVTFPKVITQSPQASLHDRAIAWHGLAGQRVEGAAHTAVQLLDEAGAATAPTR